MVTGQYVLVDSLNLRQSKKHLTTETLNTRKTKGVLPDLVFTLTKVQPKLLFMQYSNLFK